MTMPVGAGKKACFGYEDESSSSSGAPPPDDPVSRAPIEVGLSTPQIGVAFTLGAEHGGNRR